MAIGSSYEKRVLEVLQSSHIPLSIEAVRAKAGIKSWVTAKAVLLELLIKGEIVGMKTDKSWVFGKSPAMKLIQVDQSQSNRG
jgi:hypothetical protein